MKATESVWYAKNVWSGVASCDFPGASSRLQIEESRAVQQPCCGGRNGTESAMRPFAPVHSHRGNAKESGFLDGPRGVSDDLREEGR